MKIKFEKIDLKFSNSEKRFIPKKFDLNYQYSEKNQINIINKNQNQNNQNQDDTLKNIINSQNDSSDMNINILKVVNNNVDELNNGIKNIVKEGIPSSADITQNKQNNIFTKSLKELLKLDQQKSNEDENLDNSANIQSKEIENKMSIESIKEEKEEYEKEKENDITNKNSIDLIKCERNINFSIIPIKKFDKKKIILVYMFEKQIKYN